MALRRPAAPRVRPDRPDAPGTEEPPTVAERSARAAAPALPAAESAAPAATPHPAAPSPARRTPPRRTLLLAGAAVAAVVGAVSAGVVVTRQLDPAASRFSDVADGAEGLEEMIWADGTGVLPATGGAFSPDTVVTRGEVAAALHRFAGTPAVPLEDVPVLIVDLGENQEQASALLWLHGRGALWGDAELRVHPAEPATRDCASGMLAALLRPALAGVGAVWTAAETTGPTEVPRDAAWLTSAGMIPRRGDGWAGESAVTRAELATVLHRADGVIARALG